MIKAECSYDTIKLCWSKRKEKTKDMKYRLAINGQAYYTDKTCFNLNDLQEGQVYEITLELVKNWVEHIGKKETCCVHLPKKWTIVDVTKPPYNIVGDGKTDNTKALQRAFDDSVRECKVMYFPKGEYLYVSIESEGNFHVQLDGGAKLCQLNNK